MKRDGTVGFPSPAVSERGCSSWSQVALLTAEYIAQKSTAIAFNLPSCNHFWNKQLILTGLATTSYPAVLGWREMSSLMLGDPTVY